jgi:hypothetical protein
MFYEYDKIFVKKKSMRQTDKKTDDYAPISEPIMTVLICTFPLKFNFSNAAKHLLHYWDEKNRNFFFHCVCRNCPICEEIIEFYSSFMFLFNKYATS